MDDFVPIEIPLEDVVVGVLMQFHKIDEKVIRDRWRSTEGQSLEARVEHVVGGRNSILYDALIGTVNRALR